MDDYYKLQRFIEHSRDDILKDLAGIVAELKPVMESSPALYTEYGANSPSIDVRLCIDLDGARGGTWIIRIGSVDYDQRHSEYCGAASIGVDDDPTEILNDLISQLSV